MEELRNVVSMFKEEAANSNIRDFVDKLGPLHRSVAVRDEVLLEKLLRQGEDPDDDDGTPFKYTAVHWAAMMSNKQILRLLDKYGANMSAVEETDMTPLHVAALAGNSETLIWLIENTHDIEAKEEYEQTPLHQAALNGQLEAVKILVDLGASMEATDGFGMTPVCIAAVQGFSDLVYYFLKRGANICIRDVCGKTLLHAAAASNDVATIGLLLKKGVAVNIRDYSNSTPLHEAAKYGNCRAISFLLENGADANIKDNMGRSPIDITVNNGLVEQGTYQESSVKTTMDSSSSTEGNSFCVRESSTEESSLEDGIIAVEERNVHADNKENLIAGRCMQEEDFNSGCSEKEGSLSDSCKDKAENYSNENCFHMEDDPYAEDGGIQKDVCTSISELTFEEIMKILF